MTAVVDHWLQNYYCLVGLEQKTAGGASLPVALAGSSYCLHKLSLPLASPVQVHVATALPLRLNWQYVGPGCRWHCQWQKQVWTLALALPITRRVLEPVANTAGGFESAC